MNSNLSSNASSGRSYKRSLKNILIHRPMQREFTLVITALLMMSMFAVGFIVHDTFRDAAYGYHFGKINPYEVLSEVRYELILKITLVLFAALVIIAFFGVLFLHRVAGPVHRFQLVFMRINHGHLPATFKLREGDFFSETAQEINQHVLSLNEKDKQLAQAREKINRLIDSNPLIKNDLEEIKRLTEMGWRQA